MVCKSVTEIKDHAKNFSNAPCMFVGASQKNRLDEMVLLSAYSIMLDTILIVI